ncbi:MULTISPECIES: NADH-quinone oxidoreductase subunit NuoK [Photobacterium]|uniref:NADH-quinone oxidoreductase subunit K n=4 Tax=Photobacterium TaxID=657 RepID=X0NY11_PHOLE|nr:MULTISPECIES: NADH-quinone oxidoreductase subunit NuoK [Photobacterium]KJF81004.1 2-hydroxyacid dehydrogenase [Photobacterium damselae subsp. damselae]EAS65212.1 NADH dehydrogenase I chain K [Photobacterium angustum S14]KJF92753.1 2-hydroxyacid dehydrogenase [Photobacterium angustum]KJF97839.1 2-hydroxyacid dehydrogenase [Photobacterium leiognathi]KJG02580.1 2-hydroxyacid dehydrogenase [Photobacterium angustum]
MSPLTILILSFAMFIIGLLIVVVRRQLLFVLMGIEVMLNGVALAAVEAGQHWGNPTGQIITIFLMIAAGCELSVVLMLAMLSYKHLKTTRIDKLNQLSNTLISKGEL